MIKNKIKKLLGLTKEPCQIMAGLTFRSIPVNYSSAIINGVERPSGVKVWNVAVKTTEPKEVYTSYTQWCYEMMVLRGNLVDFIGLMEHHEITRNAERYRNLMMLKVAKPIKNS